VLVGSEGVAVGSLVDPLILRILVDSEVRLDREKDAYVATAWSGCNIAPRTGAPGGPDVECSSRGVAFAVARRGRQARQFVAEPLKTN
jgi:hypothetical protein